MIPFSHPPCTANDQNHNYQPKSGTIMTTNLKICSIIILILLCIACIPAVTAIDTDYRIAVSSIIQDPTLTPLQKNTAQAELFGWTESLGLYLTETLVTDTIEDPDTNEIVSSKSTEPNVVTMVLRTFGIAASPLSKEEGEVAWTDYLSTYVANYQGSYAYK